MEFQDIKFIIKSLKSPPDNINILEYISFGTGYNVSATGGGGGGGLVRHFKIYGVAYSLICTVGGSAGSDIGPALRNKVSSGLPLVLELLFLAAREIAREMGPDWYVVWPIFHASFIGYDILGSRGQVEYMERL